MDADQTAKGAGLKALYGEHLALGAVFGPDRTVMSYAQEESADAARNGAVLVDLTHTDMLLFSGAAASAYAHTAFAGSELGVGACAFEAVLTGDGSLASVPLLARTGMGEYLVVDGSSRAEVLEGWLSFIAGVEQNGVAPFHELVTDDVSGSHVVLGLWGPAASAVLGDYLHGQSLPPAGGVSSMHLDRIPCIVLRLPKPVDDLYLVLVPPVHAVVLWRSFLSFKQVEPIGTEACSALWKSRVPWAGALNEAGPLKKTRDELQAWGLARDSGDFVGARGLK